MQVPSLLLTLADGRVLAADDVGDPQGFPVVYVHGTPDSRLARHPDDGVATVLGVRLVAIDRPGFGHSSPHPDGTHGSFGHDVVALLDHLDIGRFATLGWSAGALGALAVSGAAPDRAAAAGVAAGLPPFEAYGQPGILDGADAGRQAIAELGAELGPTETAALLAPYVAPVPITHALACEHLLEGADATRRATYDAVPGALDQMAEALVDAVRGGLDGVTRDLELQVEPPDVDLGTVTCPVRLWYGGLDTTSPPGFGRWYESHLPDATLELLPTDGHLFPLLRWGELLAALAAYQ